MSRTMSISPLSGTPFTVFPSPKSPMPPGPPIIIISCGGGGGGGGPCATTNVAASTVTANNPKSDVTQFLNFIVPPRIGTTSNLNSRFASRESIHLLQSQHQPAQSGRYFHPPTSIPSQAIPFE